jgi:hypothetical protein
MARGNGYGLYLESNEAVHYFVGKDPSQWHTNIPTYSKVRFSSLFGPITLTGSETIQAIALGAGEEPSEIATSSFTIQ